MRSCAICTESVAQGANLCSPCADLLKRPAGFCAEQLLASVLRPTQAALVDSWGRVHQLEEFTPIGRRPAARGVAILEASVSRNHAELSLDAAGTWILRDVGSSNGTRLDGEVVVGETALSQTCRIAFGEVELYFAPDSSNLNTGTIVASTATIRPEDEVQFGSDELDELAAPGEATFAGFPKLPIALYQPSEGGGGIVSIADKSLQLTVAQFELLEVLVARMLENSGLPIEVRGFTPSAHLIAAITWDTPYPTENHLKQLIRRVRKLLEGEGFGNLLESRRGLGYRLRCIPVDAPQR